MSGECGIEGPIEETDDNAAVHKKAVLARQRPSLFKIRQRASYSEQNEND